MSTGPGGFLRSSLLSPPLSSAASSTGGGPLPTPRHSPLKSGSQKESAFIDAVDQRLLQVTRKFAKKEARSEDPTHWRHQDGYTSFNQAAKDIDRVIDLVWVSGTPSVQIPYLLTLAGLVLTYIPAFPPAPRPLFSVLGKLDYAFASLLQGKDLESGDMLPGIAGRFGVNETQKVRMKSLVERTRVEVVEALNSEEFEPEEDEEDDDEMEGETTTETDGMDVHMGVYMDDTGNDYDMDVARVYQRTLEELGDTFLGLEIGIPQTMSKQDEGTTPDDDMTVTIVD